MNRVEQLAQLRNRQFDLCIIGAGASGAGVALDAALRGYTVCLIDRSDFSAETSSRSTKLIHGGVRYLEQAFKKLDFAQLKQVKHGLAERKTLIKNASHLAGPLGLITPVFSWMEGLYYSIGLRIYGLIAGDDGMPRAQWLNKKETFLRMPGLTKKLHSSILYYDGMFDDARYVIALVQSSVKEGAVAANYVSFQSFEKNKEGKLTSAHVTDELSGEQFEIKANVYVNCTGPYSDYVRLAANPAEEPRMRPSKGVHLVFPGSYLQSKEAMLIPETSDGRVVFVKPLDNEVMVGTTDTPYDQLEKEPMLESDEIDYLLETLRSFMEKMPDRSEIKAGFAGIRPLLAAKRSNRKETKSLLRDHEVELDEVSGLVSLLGGKWTTYRVMAQDCVDLIGQLTGREVACSTSDHHLAGNQVPDFDKENFRQLALQKGLQEESIRQLLSRYGDQSPRLLEIIEENKSLAEPILENYPFLLAEVIYAIRFEMAVKLRDFLSRRIRLEITDWEGSKKAAEKIAPYFQRELGWEDEQRKYELSEYNSMIEEFQRRAFAD